MLHPASSPIVTFDVGHLFGVLAMVDYSLEGDEVNQADNCHCTETSVNNPTAGIYGTATIKDLT